MYCSVDISARRNLTAQVALTFILFLIIVSFLYPPIFIASFVPRYHQLLVHTYQCRLFFRVYHQLFLHTDHYHFFVPHLLQLFLETFYRFFLPYYHHHHHHQLLLHTQHCRSFLHHYQLLLLTYFYYFFCFPLLSAACTHLPLSPLFS